MDNIKHFNVGDEWPPEQRKLLHSIFNEWLTKACTDADFEKLVAVREQIMPMRPCSIVTLIRLGFAQPEILDDFPPSLVQLMRERNLLHDCDVIAMRWPVVEGRHR